MPTIAQIDTPLGPVTGGVTDRGVCLLSFQPIDSADEHIDEIARKHNAPVARGDHPMLDRLGSELNAYFAGELTGFTVPFDTPGTDWERKVWDALVRIPFGQTTSYGSLARQLDNPGGSRAVGLANGRNRVAILIPCHRVIASDGSLHGYASGLERKEWLLDHEKSVSGVDSGLFGTAPAART